MHAMAPTQRFSDRARAYARHRPDYPVAAIEFAIAGLGDPKSLVVADVGAGTGISSRLLAATAARVHAVEPNADMRAEGAGAALAGSIEWVEGSAEATTLGAGSVELVLCAQAFHWFRHREALDEFARILRAHTPSGAPGRLALIWNDRDMRDAFTAEYSRLIREASGDHPAERDFDPQEIVAAHARFGNVRVRAFPHAQALDLEGALGRALSASYAPKSGPAHDRMIEGLQAAHARLADERGIVRLVYLTRVYLADVRAG